LLIKEEVREDLYMQAGLQIPYVLLSISDIDIRVGCVCKEYEIQLGQGKAS
jgi:hypothetical protein